MCLAACPGSCFPLLRSPRFLPTHTYTHPARTLLLGCGDRGIFILKKRGREGEDTVQLWGVFPPFLWLHQAANRVTVSFPPFFFFLLFAPLFSLRRRRTRLVADVTSMFPPWRCVTHKPSLCFSPPVRVPSHQYPARVALSAGVAVRLCFPEALKTSGCHK